ncbi:MAG: hypothetical protein KDB66_01700 [Solirubrobacterales bacterium]|nr:hypothetical protein [Solirubrobacterales bacterium]MCB8915157.1 hypothetical protein [Thermoleophilales bacterium]
MKTRETAAKVAILIGALVACLALSAPATSAKTSKAPIFWIDLMGTASKHPRHIFFSANAGSQVNKIKWNGWGKNRSVGRGHYFVTSPPPPGRKNPEGPARIVVWKPFKCVPAFGNRKGKVTWMYSHARMLRPVPSGGRKWVDISAYAGEGACR